jgi:hypothetical protein
MSLEKRVRSIGHKSIAYPWLRRYVSIGPFNRRVRHEMGATVLVRVLGASATRAAALRRRLRRNGKLSSD